MNDNACSKCKGTGADPQATRNARAAGRIDEHSFIRCWHCNGNGLDPAKFFRWGTPAKK